MQVHFFGRGYGNCDRNSSLWCEWLMTWIFTPIDIGFDYWAGEAAVGLLWEHLYKWQECHSGVKLHCTTETFNPACELYNIEVLLMSKISA